MFLLDHLAVRYPMTVRSLNAKFSQTPRLVPDPMNDLGTSRLQLLVNIVNILDQAMSEV